MVVYILTAIAGVIAAPFLRLRFFIAATFGVCAAMVALSFAIGGWSPAQAFLAFAIMQITYLCTGLALDYFIEPKSTVKPTEDEQKLSHRRR